MATAGVELLEHIASAGGDGVRRGAQARAAHCALLRRLRARIASGGVALVVLVDYAGFNMSVAAEARAAGVPVLYFITPQVWAWRAGPAARAGADRHARRGDPPVRGEAAARARHRRDVRGASAARPRAGDCPTARRRAARLGHRARRRRCSRCSRGAARRRSSGTSTPSSRPRASSQRRDPALRVVVSAAPHRAHRSRRAARSRWCTRHRSRCCAPPTRRCARAARRRSRRRSPAARSSSRTAPSR